MAEGENIRVLVVEPAKVPYERTISTLEEMQEIVGGHIETVHPFADDPVALVVNENGKMLDLPYNRAIMDESGLIPEDMIQGTFFIAGVGSEDFVSLTDEQIGRYAICCIIQQPDDTHCGAAAGETARTGGASAEESAGIRHSGASSRRNQSCGRVSRPESIQTEYPLY